MTPTLYLASNSPRRRQLLREAGITFERFAISVDEDALTAAYTGPLELLGEYLAQRKALATFEALQQRQLEALVLASDTTVLVSGRSLPKPRDLAEAEEMLRTLRGREHVVATGVALCGPATGDTRLRHLGHTRAACATMTTRRSRPTSRPATRSTRPAPTRFSIPISSRSPRLMAATLG